MSFDYEIKANPANALAANQKVVASLDGIEKKAAETGEAMGKWDQSKLRDTQNRFIATAVASEQLKSKVADLTDQWKREDAILEQIKGPAREYEANMRALNNLHETGAVDAKEYESQLEKIENTKKRAESGGGEKEGPNLESAMGALKSAAAAGGVIELAKGISELIETGERLDDEYTKLANEAMRFVDANHSLNSVMEQQMELADQLHSTMEPTVRLYTAVTEQLDELNLSTDEQLRLTRTLGEAAELGGKSMSSAESVISRLAVAMEAGTGAGRQMRSIIVEFPALAKLWEEAFDTDKEGLIRMANTGQLSLAQLMDAATKYTKGIDAEHDKRKRTNEMEIDEMNGRYTVFRKTMGNEQAFIEAVSPAYREMGEQIRDLQDPTREQARQQQAFNNMIDDGVAKAKRFVTEALSPGKKTAEEYASAIAGATKKLEDLNAAHNNGAISEEYYRASEEQLAATINGHVPIVMKYQNSLAAARESLAELNQAHADGAISEAEFRKQQEQLLGTLQDTVPAATKYAHTIQEAKESLDDLNKANQMGIVVGEAYRKKQEELLTTLNDGRLPATIKMWHELHDAVEQNDRDVGALIILDNKGRVSAMEFAIEQHKLFERDPRQQEFLAFLKMQNEEYDKSIAKAKEQREAAEHGIVLPSAAGLVGPNFSDAERQGLEDLAVAKREDLALDKEMEDFDKKGLEIVNTRIELLKSLATPAEKLQIDINNINKAFAEGSGGSAADYDRLMGDLKMKFFDVTPEQKYAKALEELDAVAKLLKPSTEDLARAQDELAKRFNQPRSLTAGLEDGWLAVKKQMMDVAGPASQLVTDAFKSIEGAILELVNTGEVNWSKMVDSMLDDLARLAIRELEMQLITSIGGVPIPGHATGAQWFAAGPGGTDSSLQAFYATPGERITVETPSQQASSERSRQGGGGGVQAVAHFHIDPRELLAAGDSPAGERQTLQVIRRNPGAIRSWLGGGARR